MGLRSRRSLPQTVRPVTGAVLPGIASDGKVRPVTPDGGPVTHYEQTYTDATTDLDITVAAPTRGAVQRVTGVSVDTTEMAKTHRGVAVGASKRAVKKAYPKATEPIEHELWVPINAREMFFIMLADGKVSAISLGPARDPRDIEE